MRLFRHGLLLITLAVSSLPIASAQADFVKPDTPPVPVKTPPPQFPANLKGTAGVVTVAIVIDAQGNVTSAEINKSSHPDFEAPSLQAVKKWRFTPAKKDNQAISARVIVPLHFQED